MTDPVVRTGHVHTRADHSSPRTRRGPAEPRPAAAGALDGRFTGGPSRPAAVDTEPCMDLGVLARRRPT
jgi:hypothetical protein